MTWHGVIVVAGAAGLALGLLGRAGAAEPEPPPFWDCNRIPDSNAEQLSLFLNAFCHRQNGWAHDNKARLAGPVVDGVYYSAHGPVWVRVYYSPPVYTWMLKGRPDDEPLPSGSLIVKEQFTYQPDKAGPGPLEGWTVMLKDERASHDGWIWGYVGYRDTQWDDVRPFLPYCVACHASADNKELTFSDVRRIVGIGDEGGWVPPPPTGSSGSTGTEPSGLPPSGKDSGMAGGGAGDASGAAVRAPGRPALSTPLEAPDAAFAELFPWPDRIAKAAVKRFPRQETDHVVPRPDKGQPFVTSSVCSACHDSDSLLADKTPDMMVNIAGHNFNFSPYGEWSASPMGLAGRDPIFHAQLESERTLHPELADIFDDTCFSCHGIMGRRQLALDSAGRPGGPRRFTHDMVYATPGAADAKYGALARDGISCTICHRISPERLAAPETYTGRFEIGPVDTIYGPYDDIKKYSMESALGFTPKFSAHMRESALCGSCHTVVLPALEVDRAYAPEDFASATTHHEQTTYNEWRNSGYWTPDYPDQATTCQSCHMPRTVEDVAPFTPDKPLELTFRIANIQDAAYPPYMNQAPDDRIALKVRKPFARHMLLGINQFVLHMYHQFNDILGINPVSPNINRRENAVESLALAATAGLHMARHKTARLAVETLSTSAGMLVAKVKVESLVGHKLPSGVGFRRAFLDFQVQDGDGRVLWASGRPSPLGVILDGEGAPLATEFSRGEWQPHHERITRQDQAQIYEERHLDSRGRLTTSFFSLAKKVKDTRLLPKGWAAKSAGQVRPQDFDEMIACDYDPRADICAPMTDPYFVPGQGGGGDEITYEVPLSEIPGAARVVARLHYQAIPPYYLRDRFETARGPETQRLYFIASHLNVEGLSIAGWTLTVAETARALPVIQ